MICIISVLDRMRTVEPFGVMNGTLLGFVGLLLVFGMTMVFGVMAPVAPRMGAHSPALFSERPRRRPRC